ncbi:hypothetical protein Bca4012_091125 [Brassica carinata]
MRLVKCWFCSSTIYRSEDCGGAVVDWLLETVAIPGDRWVWLSRALSGSQPQASLSSSSSPHFASESSLNLRHQIHKVASWWNVLYRPQKLVWNQTNLSLRILQHLCLRSLRLSTW